MKQVGLGYQRRGRCGNALGWALHYAPVSRKRAPGELMHSLGTGGSRCTEKYPTVRERESIEDSTALLYGTIPYFVEGLQGIRHESTTSKVERYRRIHGLFWEAEYSVLSHRVLPFACRSQCRSYRCIASSLSYLSLPASMLDQPLPEFLAVWDSLMC